MASKPGGPCWQGRRRRCHFILYITAIITLLSLDGVTQFFSFFHLLNVFTQI